MTLGAPVTGVREGDLLWTPSREWVEATNLTAFLRWLGSERGRPFAGYQDLWEWSVADLEGFWQAVWDYFGVRASTPPAAVLEERRMPGARWFPGARLNLAEHVLRHERPGADALLYGSETAPLQGMPWETLAGGVRRLATWLREQGVAPGDRVVGILPNVPETMMLMLATAAVGAVWAACSPEFGWRGVLDRFQQLEPKVLVATDGYRFGGRVFDRRQELGRIVAGLPSLERVVRLGVLDRGDPLPDGWFDWGELLAGPPVPAEGFEYEQVPFDHPLWVLFSSGTTGLPKAIVHGHGGIMVEHLKLQTFHIDLRAGDRLFFYTTSGWMMWNFLVTAPALDVVPVLYDGSPVHPDPGVLWRVAQDSRAAATGSSPAFVALMRKAGLVPGREHDLSSLRTVFPAGAPVSPEVTEWFYRNVKRDLWVATGSGGTDCCCGFVGGVPTLPVHAGEIQAPSLGVAARAFDEHGHSVVDQVGEMVITQPMPSMPLYLWGDPDGRRYHETYFADYPGVWRQGDFFRINRRGGCFVLGRSDATLNRHGVRIGTAEIYRALERIPEIDDALVVNLDLPGSRSFMPLFVVLGSDRKLDAGLEQAIRRRLRDEYSPRHVPDRIVQVSGIPMTLTGKKMEVPVRKILQGTPPEQAANPNAMANPQALDDFVAYARSQHDYPLD